MKEKKLQVSKIEDKIDLEDVEIQDSDPCKDKYLGIYDCLRDCANQTPRASEAY